MLFPATKLNSRRQSPDGIIDQTNAPGSRSLGHTQDGAVNEEAVWSWPQRGCARCDVEQGSQRKLQVPMAGSPPTRYSTVPPFPLDSLISPGSRSRSRFRSRPTYSTGSRNACLLPGTHDDIANKTSSSRGKLRRTFAPISPTRNFYSSLLYFRTPHERSRLDS